MKPRRETFRCWQCGKERQLVVRRQCDRKRHAVTRCRTCPQYSPWAKKRAERMAALSRQGMRNADIAREMNATPTQVWRALRKEGVK